MTGERIEVCPSGGDGMTVVSDPDQGESLASEIGSSQPGTDLATTLVKGARSPSYPVMRRGLKPPKRSRYERV